MKVECNNCKWRGQSDELAEIQDFYLRVEPGDEVPAGQCPECGALCSICQDEPDDEDDDLTDERLVR